jgi:ABC-type polysaccharide/polyol phosphate transport system ATPase subunit
VSGDLLDHRVRSALARVRVEGLGKWFARGEGEQFAPVRPVFARFRKKGFGGVGGLDDDDDPDFEDGFDLDSLEEEEATRGVGGWALQDVSFEVGPGSALGVVGGPGAGRTTLIRLLGELTPPTTGRIELSGTVAPTVDFATAFMPAKADARDSFNRIASLRGIPRRDRHAWEDAGVDLALGDGTDGLSPMDVRRRLAVAAALEPEADIYLLDGLPKLGDPSFLARCLERVEAVRARGAAIVFASTNLEQIMRICDRALWLEGGRVVECGEVTAVVDAFRRAAHHRTASAAVVVSELRGFNGDAVLLSTVVEADGDDLPPAVALSDELRVRITLETAQARTLVRCGVTLRTESVTRRFVQEEAAQLDAGGRYSVLLRLPPRSLPEGFWMGDVEATVSVTGQPEVLGRPDAFSLVVQPDDDDIEAGSEEADSERDDDSIAGEPWVSAEWVIEPEEP